MAIKKYYMHYVRVEAEGEASFKIYGLLLQLPMNGMYILLDNESLYKENVKSNKFHIINFGFKLMISKLSDETFMPSIIDNITAYNAPSSAQIAAFKDTWDHIKENEYQALMSLMSRMSLMSMVGMIIPDKYGALMNLGLDPVSTALNDLYTDYTVKSSESHKMIKFDFVSLHNKWDVFFWYGDQDDTPIYRISEVCFSHVLRGIGL